MQKVINIIRVAGEIVSALWAVIGSLQQAVAVVPNQDREWGIFVAILVLIMLAFWRIYENHLRIKPKIEVFGVRPFEWKIYSEKLGSETTNTTHSPYISTRVSIMDDKPAKFIFDTVAENQYYFALVDYINNPGIRTESATAKKVIGGIYYYDESGKPLIENTEIIGRWWDEPEPKDIPSSQPPHTLQEVDISPSGKKRRTLVIAIKHKSEDVFFAYDLSSISYHEWRKKEYLLGTGRKYIKVTLAGENVDDFTRWFCVYQTKEKEMKIDIIDPPIFSKVRK